MMKIILKSGLIIAAGASAFLLYKWLKLEASEGSKSDDLLSEATESLQKSESLKIPVKLKKTVRFEPMVDLIVFQRDYHEEPNYMTIIPQDWNDLLSESESESEPEEPNMSDGEKYHCSEQPSLQEIRDMFQDSDSEAEDPLNETY